MCEHCETLREAAIRAGALLQALREQSPILDVMAIEGKALYLMCEHELREALAQPGSAGQAAAE